MSKFKKVPIGKIQDEAKNFSHPADASTALERKIFDLPLYKKDGKREGVSEKVPYVVLKYFRSGWECFSEWEKDELRAFSSFLDRLSSSTWGNIYKSAGAKGEKTGFGYTKYEIDTAKSGQDHLKRIRDLISDEIDFFELRVNQKIRIHGFQSQSAFFLVLLDRQHRVFSG